MVNKNVYTNTQQAIQIHNKNGALTITTQHILYNIYNRGIYTNGEPNYFQHITK